jgi:LPXTG-motif cell wall-anchored protein
MAEALLWVSLVLGAVMVLGAAYLSYRRRRRKAQARSRAALNKLLAEADEIAQSRRKAPDGGEAGS